MPLINSFVLSCEWTPEVDQLCQILDLGETRVGYASNVITFTKNTLNTATIPYTFVAGVPIKISARVHSVDGMDIFVDGVKGANNADTGDIISPNAQLFTGSNQGTSQHINGNIGAISIINGDISDRDITGTKAVTHNGDQVVHGADEVVYTE